jgi:hypothetical protein
MKRWLASLAILFISIGFVGCGSGATKPQTDAEGKPVKAPEVPTNGV